MEYFENMELTFEEKHIHINQWLKPNKKMRFGADVDTYMPKSKF